MIYTSTLTSKGQTTIPVALREMFGLRDGDALRFEKKEEGILMKREKSMEERLAELQEYSRKRMKELGIKPAKDYDKAMDEYYETREGKKALREMAGLYD